MVRASVSRWGVAVLAAAAVLSGCSCPGPDECSDVTSVVFEDPIDGATVTSPFDVHLTARDANGGSTAKLESASLTIDNGQPLMGSVTDATATFAQVQLEPGPHMLTAQVGHGTCGKTGTINITVKSETCTTPAVTAVSFPQDTSNDGILNAAELPMGTNLQVQVAAECTTGVQVQIKRNGAVVGGPTDFSNGVATVTLPTLPDADSGTFDLTAELVKDGAPVGMGLGGSIRVERALPTCENTTVLVQGPKTGGTGTEHLLAASGSTSGVAAEFRLDGAQTMTSTPSMGTVSASWSVPKTGETTYAVELRCTDNFGNVATDTKMVRVDYVAPTAVITQPTANPDGGASAVTDSPTAVTVMTNAEDGSQVCATLNAMPVGCASAANGSASIDVPFSMDGTFTIEVTVTDLAGNETTTSTLVEAVLQGCGLGWIRPSTDPALITASAVNNGNYSFQTQSKTICVGQACRMAIQEVFTDGGLGVSSPIGMSTIDSAGRCTIPWAADGGTFVVSAEVDNLSDAGVDSASCDVTVDLLGPAIQSPIVPTGQPYATVNLAQDTQPSTPGAQRLLQFSASVPAGGRVDVCTTQAIDPETMVQRATSVECGTGWYVLASGVTSPASGFSFPEGTYSIKIVVVANGVTSTSPDLPLFVDVTRPCVRKLANPWPQDGAGGGMVDARLNIAELGTAAPRLQFELDPACKDFDPSTLSTTTPVVVKEILNGALSGSFNLPANATFASGVYSVDLTQSIANEQDYQFVVVLTDKAGNTNNVSATIPATHPARYDVRIDKVAPSCSIVAPSASDTLLGLAQVPGGQFTVTVATVGDVMTNGVAVALGGPTPSMRTITPVAPANQATTVFALTGTANWTVDSTCTDIAGNATAATQRALRIDLDRPTCHIDSPTNTMAYGTNQIATSVTVGGVSDGRIVTCSTNGTTLTPSLSVLSGTAAGTITYPNGTQTVSCTVVDGAGNDCTDTVVGVVVNSTACGLALTSPQQTASGFWHNRTNTSNLTATTGTATVTAHTADCGAGKTVTLVRTAPTMGTPTTAMTDASGNVSFPGVAVADGETWTVSIDNGAGVTTPQTFQVGLVAPSATGVTIGGTAVTTGANLTFVAAAGNRNVELGTANYFADTNPGTNGAQLDVGVTGVTGAIKAGIDGTVELVFKGAVVTSQAVTTANQNFSFTGATLPHNDSGAFEVRIRDTAGNSTSVINNPTAIDVIAPGAPAVTQTLTNARAAQVTLQWAPTYDDGATAASGAHAGYDVRWTTSSVPSNNAMAASTDYFGSSSYQDTLSAWSASNINRVLDLPPLNTYYIAVRAKDEVGNYSTFAAPTPIVNMWTELTLTVAGAVADFGQTVLASNNVIGNSANDVVVSAPSRGNVGSVYVFQGGPGFATQMTCAAPNCQELVPPDATGAFFGSDVSISGNVADDASDTTTTGMADVVVGQRSFAPNGRVFIFLGTSGASISHSIEIRGDATSTTIGWTARTIADLDGDGYDEIAIPAYLYGSGRGRVYVFKGRALADWQAAYVPGQQYVSVGSANWVIEGEYLYPSSPVNTSNGLGLNRMGLASLPGVTGRLRPDGGVSPELVVSVPRANVSRVAIYGGDQVTSSSAGTPLGAFDAGIQVLSQTPSGTNSIALGFGAAISAVGPVQRMDQVDMYVGYPNEARVYRYSNWSPTGVVGGAATEYFQGASGFGANLASGDLNGDGRPDLIVGEGQSSGNGAWVLYQRSGGFDTPVGSVAQFNVSVIRPVRTGGLTNSMPNRFLAVGNIGTGGTVLLLSDTATGSVRVWK